MSRILHGRVGLSTAAAVVACAISVPLVASAAGKHVNSSGAGKRFDSSGTLKHKSKLRGPRGATGSTGTTGPSGTTGSSGAIGLAGAAGANGVTGPMGPKGEPGATAAKGERGATGEKGATGERGATGPTGAGATGPTGASGSALWAVVNGNGSLARGSGAEAASEVGEGIYQVRFDRNVESCAYEATLGTASISEGNLPEGSVSVGPGEEDEEGKFTRAPDDVEVQTHSGGGSAVALPFHLSVSC